MSEALETAEHLVTAQAMGTVLLTAPILAWPNLVYSVRCELLPMSSLFISFEPRLTKSYPDGTPGVSVGYGGE